ncbi:MAG: tetratricopeptide repeat protein, partial [Planctomycetes bacterium]|nr:tetratricopeptide repeat protein [Planctomycetota bacterium]
MSDLPNIRKIEEPLLMIRCHRKKILVVLMAFTGMLWIPTSLWAQRDTIFRSDTGKRLTVDQVVSETYQEVRYKSRNAEKTIASDKVEKIVYHDIPPAFESGLSFLEKGEYENAVNSFDLAMEKKGVRGWVKTYGLLYTAKAFQQWGLSSSAKFKDAIATYKRLMEVDPETRFYAEALFGLADSYALSGDLANAIKTYDQLAQDAYEKKLGVKWEARARYEKALAQLNGGAYDDAERDFRSAMTFATEQAKSAQTDPLNVGPLNRIAGLSRLYQGSVLIKKNKIREARKFFDEIIEDSASGREAMAGAECGLG